MEKGGGINLTRWKGSVATTSSPRSIGHSKSALKFWMVQWNGSEKLPTRQMGPTHQTAVGSSQYFVHPTDKLPTRQIRDKSSTRQISYPPDR